MKTNKQRKVVSIKDASKEKVREEAELHAQALLKDEPSAEAKAYYDKRLLSDPDAWRSLGDLMSEATDLAFKGFWLGYGTKASVKHGAELLKKDLGYDSAPPLERLLIEQVVMCYVRLGMIEHEYSRTVRGEYSMKVAEHMEGRLTQAQRRYVRATISLARVRGLLVRVQSEETRASLRAVPRALTGT
jgi:hypothetical protein